MANKCVRLTPDLERELQEACKARGITNPSAFIRTAIRNELTDRADAIQSTEQRIARAIDRQVQDIALTRGETQALFAVVDTLVRVVLTCLPAPEGEALAAAEAQASARYQKFVKVSGARVASLKGKAMVAGAGEES